MNRIARLSAAAAFAVSPIVLTAQDENPQLAADYFYGFSQGMYYGLMLAGTDYDIAWCVKGEVAYEGEALGSGAEFQEKLERIMRECTAGH